MSVLSHVLGQVGHQLSRDEDESEKKKKTIVFFGVRAVTLLLDDGRLICMYTSTQREREDHFRLLLLQLCATLLHLIFVRDFPFGSLFFLLLYGLFHAIFKHTHTHAQGVCVVYVSHYKTLRCR